jgi:cytosine deaminase
MAEADLGVIANPFANMVLQGRHDTYPKRRGMTRVPELMAAGLTVALGHDSVMDPWYGLGSGDMLDVAHMAVHVAQMTGLEAMTACFAAVTENAAKLLHLEGYGLAPGCQADMVLLDAHDPVEAIRLRATRLKVIRRGKIIAETPMQRTSLTLPGRPGEVSFLGPPNKS